MNGYNVHIHYGPSERHHLRTLAEQQRQSAEDIARINQERATEAAERFKKETVDTLIKIQSAMFSSGQAYTNVVIIGGYAASFTIWSYTRLYLAERAAIWAALLLMISVVTFIGWEIIDVLPAFHPAGTGVRGL